MSASVMTTRRVFLDPQPGGVAPTLHLKPGTTGIRLQIYIRTQVSDGTGFTTSSGKRAVLKGKRPDGQEIYLTSTTSYLNGGRDAYVLFSSSAHFKTLTAVPGTYVLELSVFDTTSTVNRNNEANYDMITAEKFYLCVDETA